MLQFLTLTVSLARLHPKLRAQMNPCLFLEATLLIILALFAYISFGRGRGRGESEWRESAAAENNGRADRGAVENIAALRRERGRSSGKWFCKLHFTSRS